MRESASHPDKAINVEPIKLDEEDLEHKTNLEILSSLGEDFNVCLEAMQTTANLINLDIPPILLKKQYNKETKEEVVSFNDTKFFELLNKLKKEKPIYLEHAKKLFQEEMEGKTEETNEEIEKEMAELYKEKSKPNFEPNLIELAANFANRIEFFSRIENKTPDKITLGKLKTVKQIERDIRRVGAQVFPNGYATEMMNSPELKDSLEKRKAEEEIDLVPLTVSDLFNNDGQNHTLQGIVAQAKKFGLKICPPETGPLYRIAYTPDGELKKEQPMGEWRTIAMKPISSGPGRSPGVFGVGRDEDGIWLDDDWANPTDQWTPDDQFVFCLSK